MKFTQLFTKTRKEAPKDETSKNGQLLIKAGFVYKEMAGVYAYLPLGLKVVENIKQIVREEMNAIGGQEIIMTALQRKELWEKTDRWDDKKVDVWFKSKLKNETEVGFGWSHEEPITEMMQNYIASYKDLPIFVYQFQTKLRNELRAKSGIMRGREFVMKDMYSYTVDAEQHDKFYNSTIEAYMNVFKRVGLGDNTFVTFASGGAFTEYSHEFQTITDAGEDVIYINRDKRIAINEEVLNEKTLQSLNITRDELEQVKTAEVGNIFNFGTAKSEQLGLNYVNEAGESVGVHLGSYGIGITRLMGVLVEHFSDENGIKWPVSVAPYKVHITGLNLENTEVKQMAEKIYETLMSAGIEVIYDNRENVLAGEKFADADLMGMPYRLVVSAKSSETSLEVKNRMTGETSKMTLDELIAKAKG